MSDFLNPYSFEDQIEQKIEQWRRDYGPDLDRRTLDDVWGLIAAEVRKYGKGERSPARDRDKLVTVAAMAKLGWVNSTPSGTS